MKNKKRLIAQISRNLAQASPPPTQPARRSGPPPTSAKRPAAAITRESRGQSERPAAGDPPRSTATGRQAAFWLDDEDRAIFHETGMLLYSQGIKPSHNLVLRAAIRMIPHDHRLVEKVRELMALDGRKVRHRKP